MSSVLKKETFVYVLILSILYFIQYQNLGGIYIDTDNYMHALRTIDFMQNPSMFERIFTQTNFPFGEISHWTRFMDILMTILALPFLFFNNIKEAVFNSGFLLTPLCALITLYFLQKIGSNILGTKSRFALYAMLLVSAQFKMIFKINRPDHHAVIIALTSCLLYLLYKYTDKQQKKIICQAAFVCGLSLWLAVEGIFLYSCTLTFLYLGYLFLHFSYKDITRFSLSYAVTCTFFWLVNPPFQGYFYADNGRLSVLFVVLSAVISGVIYLGGKFQNKIKQFIFLSCCALISLLCLYYGGYLSSPLSPEIEIAFINRISEMESGGTIYYLAYPLLGLTLLIIMFIQRQNLKVLLTLCFLLPYTILSLFAMRFSAYAILFGVLTIAYWLEQKRFGNIKFAFMTLLFCLIEFIAFTIDALYRYDVIKPIAQKPIADITFLTKYRFPDGSVVSDVFWAPQIIWYANRPTISSPYHRNVEGIIDNHKILTSSDMKEVADLIKKHHVSTIMLQQNMDEEYYVEPEKNTDKLYGKMFLGKDYPEWLEEDKNTRIHNVIILKVISDKLPTE